MIICDINACLFRQRQNEYPVNEKCTLFSFFFWKRIGESKQNYFLILALLIISDVTICLPFWISVFFTCKLWMEIANTYT